MRDININVKDGNLFSSSNKGDGIHLKIGTSVHGKNEIITFKGNVSDEEVYKKLNKCELADAVINSLDCGCETIHVLAVKKDVETQLYTATGTDLKDSEDRVKYISNAYKKFKVVVKFTRAGASNSAMFRYSLDDGRSYSEDILVPTSLTYEIPYTGITLKFSAAEEAGFYENEMWNFETWNVGMLNEEILSALDILKTINTQFEMIHIVGGTESSTWAAVSEKMNEIAQKNKKMYPVIMESKNISSDSSISQYCEELLSNILNVQNKLVQIIPARCEWKFRDGHIEDINCASIVMGLYSKAKVCQSIGETKSFAISSSRMLRLLPEGIEEYIDELDEAKFLTFRQYDGLEGYYVTNARIACPENSDYKYMEYTRAMCKIYKKAKIAALENIQSDFDVTNPQSALTAYSEYIAAPLEEMVSNKELSSVRVEPVGGQDLLTAEVLDFNIFFTPRGIAREFRLNLAMENPYKEE